MSDVHFYRNSAYRSRRVAALLRVIALLWTIAMIGVWAVNPSWPTFFVGLLGATVISFSLLLLVEVFVARADNYFYLARQAKAITPLLGVVEPKPAKTPTKRSVLIKK